MISAQPATDYYAWQVEVYLENFINVGYNPESITVLGAFIDRIPDSWIKISSKFSGVKFYFYKDEMVVRNYAPAIQAHILKKHFGRFPELSNDAIFFHDCDFVFTKYMDFSPFLNDNKWYFSDVGTYVGADYIESKGAGLLEGMSHVVGICACKVRAEKSRTGGAQKLMKGVDTGYWAEVEEDAVNLYNWLLQEKDKFGDSDVNDIQIWTASMWSELWNAWKRDVRVEIPDEFNFCWATCPIEKWDTVSFFHNAGVTGSDTGLFYKAEFIEKSPFGTNKKIDPSRCSSRYYKMITEI